MLLTHNHIAELKNETLSQERFKKCESFGRITIGTISLRLPDSLHEAARDLASHEHISINQLVTLALAEKLSALAAEQVISQRAARGSRSKFERAMAKVPDVEPEEADRF